MVPLKSTPGSSAFEEDRGEGLSQAKSSDVQSFLKSKETIEMVDQLSRKTGLTKRGILELASRIWPTTDTDRKAREITEKIVGMLKGEDDLARLLRSWKLVPEKMLKSIKSILGNKEK